MRAAARRRRTSACTATTSCRTSRSSSTSRTASGSGSSARTGFRVEALVEVRPPEAAPTSTYRRPPRDRVGALVADGGDLAMPEERLTEHAAANRESWAKEAASYVAGAERNWATDEITWGILDVPETRGADPADVDGKDVVELGCGTAYVSAWLARRGARPVGVDLTAEQLETARRMQAEARARVPARPRQRRGRAAAGRVVRPGRLRVRRVASGAIPTSGSPRRRGCSGPAASSSSSSTGRC